MKTLYLIDGHAQLFRAFHAIRTPMSSPVTKEPTNATFGFIGMLFKLLRLKPDYVAMVIDASGDRGTFRSQIYPEYKANREEPPEALWPQVERCVAVMRAIGAPVLAVEEVEADDTIATVVTRLRAAGGVGANQGSNPGEPLRIRILSKDKDLQQLLAQGAVELFDIHTDETTDEARLKAEKGITPSQVVDMLSLMGDAVDNVPGVEGIGPKTAAELIAQYGSMENLLAHAGEIKGKRGERLREAAPRLPLSQRLVQLKHDVAVDFDLARADAARFDLARLGPILKELGFNRYQEDLAALRANRGESVAEPPDLPDGAKSADDLLHMGPAQTPAGRTAKADAGAVGGLFGAIEDAERAAARAKAREGLAHRYRCVRTMADLEALIARMRSADVVALDTETTGLSPLLCKICGVSVAVTPFEAFYIPIRSPEPEAHLTEQAALDALRPALEDPSIPKCGHNLKYDLLVLRNHGVELRGIESDTMVLSYLVDSSRSSHSLDALALALLQHTNISITELIGSGKNQRSFDTVSLDRATEYAAEDADVSLRLREVLLPQTRAMGLEALSRDLETPLVGVLAELEWNGVLVEPAELSRQEARLSARIVELGKAIDAASPRAFNPDSPRQLAEILFNKPDDPAPGLGIKPRKKTKTGYSTDIEVLEELAEDASVTTPVPRLIVERRQLTKLVGTYLVALREAINPNTKRIHSSFNQTVAATGRLASSDPNLQNIPIRTEIGRDIRKAFIAPPGRVLVSADYSQIELRILAHLSRDPGLIAAFEAGEDIHRAVAAQVHGVRPEDVTRAQRDGAKMVNFGIVYGITAFGLARRLGVENDAAAKIIDDYKRRFAAITTFLQECIEHAKRLGYVETMLGRRRAIPWIASRNPSERALGERVAINSVVQGSAADLIKIAMVDLHARLSDHAAHLRPADVGGPGAPPQIEGVMMLLQIHDELVFEAPEASAEAARKLIVERMERAMALRVPLKVESASGRTWFEGK